MYNHSQQNTGGQIATGEQLLAVAMYNCKLP